MDNNSPQYHLVSLRDDSRLADVFHVQKERIWTPFMFHDVYSNRLWHYLEEVFPEYQVYLLDEAERPVAVAQTIPLVWDATLKGLPVGWADSLVRGVDDYLAGRQPNTLNALEIAIQPEYQGQGVSYTMVKAVRDLAETRHLQAVIVAVRPSMKPRYPITPMERYIHWMREDGSPFDPWLRVHWRCGGEILKTAHPSMVIEGSAEEWEQWTGMKFPESGDYVIPEALAPVQIDRAMNFGRYVEPNVWVHHPITTHRLKIT
jgi:GNAT superfamily N-acetyltransferase